MGLGGGHQLVFRPRRVLRPGRVLCPPGRGRGRASAAALAGVRPRRGRPRYGEGAALRDSPEPGPRRLQSWGTAGWGRALAPRSVTALPRWARGRLGGAGRLDAFSPAVGRGSGKPCGQWALRLDSQSPGSSKLLWNCGASGRLFWEGPRKPGRGRQLLGPVLPHLSHPALSA